MTEPTARVEQAEPQPDRCFLCSAALRQDYGEPIDGGEGVELCRACGAIYPYPALCC